jgi:hypothetical protein
MISMDDCIGISFLLTGVCTSSRVLHMLADARAATPPLFSDAGIGVVEVICR